MITLRSARSRALGAPLAVATFLCVTVFVFAPAQIYYGNIMDFPMLFAEVLPSLAAIALTATAVLTAILVVLPDDRLRRVGVAVIFALALLAWLQGTVLVWQYGVLNGQAIDWTVHRNHGLIDVTVWCLVVAGALAAGRFVNRIAVTASVALILVQTLGISLQASRSADRWINHYSFDNAERFAFSRERNVIILVLDTFQSDLFQELLDEDSGLAARFQGFTYFRNAVGGFPSTAPSIPLILTGHYYDNAVPFQDFVRSTYTTASLPQALKAANYHVYYNNPYFWPSLYADETIASYTRKRTLRWHDPDSRRRAGALIRLGLFRSLPQPGKRLLESRVTAIVSALEADAPETVESGPAPASDHAAAPHGDQPAPGDVPFFREMASRSSNTMSTPTFKYFHLWGIHPALTHDENLRPQTLPFTRANAKRQAKGILGLLENFFGALRERGVYDDSLLFIVGDHGTRFDPRLVAIDGRTRIRPGATPVATENSFGLPLVLLKRLGGSGAMTVSDAPVSLADIPRTVASAVGLPVAFDGVSMLDSNLAANRQRRVLKYNPELLRLTERYFPPMTEYTVSGFSWLEESWRRTGREFRPGEPATSPGRLSAPGTAVYRFGEPLVFGVEGNATPYLANGWADPEKRWNWTLGRSARLVFTTAVPQRDLIFRARVIPALPGALQQQRAELFANGREVGRWTVTAPGEYSARIPRSLVPGGEMELVLTFPDAVEPHSISPDLPDRRVLALAVLSAVLEETKP
jgi:hypothetical protein